MNVWRLAWNSVRFHARSHLGALLGAAVGAAVLTGALIVGDSVRATLREQALLRIGRIEFALSSGDRFFRAALGEEIRETTRGPAAAVLQVNGSAISDDGSLRANHVQVLGIEPSFWQFAQENPDLPDFGEGIAFLNEPLAQQLRVKPDDTILLRVHKPSLLSRDNPMSPQEDYAVARRFQVAGLVGEPAFGRFSLQANQVPPLTAFVSLTELQKLTEQTNRANLLLVGETAVAPDDALAAHWTLADAQLELRTAADSRFVELRSDRIFLDEPVARAALALPGDPRGILTYFVNELRADDRATPYSMVAAVSPPLVPPDLSADEILVNQWLAEDLAVTPGDAVTLRYFLPGTAQELIETNATFRVRDVVPLAGVYADRTLMPDFPGIARAEKTENWDAGFTIDMKKIRPKDEDYWKDHRGTPKAFLRLDAGQALWTNRFGTLTAVRWENAPATADIEAALLKRSDPRSLGLVFQPVREHALAASMQGQDFGQLFLGFSFFLIAAALLLIGLLFQFAIEQRAEEVGTLLAIGLLPKQVRQILLGEGLLIALIGGAAGTLGGVFYAQALLSGLNTIWNAAAAGTTLDLHVTSHAVAGGFLASILTGAITIWLVVRKQARQPARMLLSGDTLMDPPQREGRRPWAALLAVLCLAAALVLIGRAIARNELAAPEVFFNAGLLLLVGSIATVALLLRGITQRTRDAGLSAGSLALRQLTRRRRRSLATVSLLACGCFMVGAVAAFRLEIDRDPAKRASGTGGFALIGQTALPITRNLNTSEGRDSFGLDRPELEELRFVSFRMREGDEASCLNLNRAQRPRLLGVAPGDLASRQAFTFVTVTRELPDGQSPWLLLRDHEPHGDEIPAIGDEASIRWALDRNVGDVIEYLDERGRRVKLRLVASVKNSILQGNLVIDEAAFVKLFPSEPGYRIFLIDAPSNQSEATAQLLSRALRDAGLELTPAAERLARLNAVQNTYLSTFQMLGAFGLLLGSAGLAVVVLRNVLERRSELALLLAVGFTRRSVHRLVLGEHLALLLLGIAAGLLSALAAIAPALISPATALPARTLALLPAGVLVSGAAWTWLATRLALRGPLLNALRNE